MRRNYLLVLVLVLLISSTLASADDEGKPKRWWSTPLIMVLYIVFFLMAAAVALCLNHFRNRRRRHNHQGESAVERGLDAEEIESLPSLRFAEVKMHKLADEQVECAVCLTEFKDQEVLRVLPDCFHVFHPHCIAPWLASHVTCPTCRSSLEHRQGSSLSRSTILDTISGPLSQRFDHSGDQDDDDYDDNNEVTLEIEGSSTSHSEVNLNNLSSAIGKLPRSYSTGELMVHMVRKCSTSTCTSFSSLLPTECSSKSDYQTTIIKIENRSCKNSPKSDRFVDYSSLMKKCIVLNCQETTTLELQGEI